MEPLSTKLIDAIDDGVPESELLEMIDECSDVDERDYCDRTALMNLCFDVTGMYRTRLYKSLIYAGADVNAKEKVDHWNSLFAYLHFHEMHLQQKVHVKLFIDMRTDINATDWQGYTVLAHMFDVLLTPDETPHVEHEGFTKILIDAGVDLHIYRLDWSWYLLESSYKRNSRIVRCNKEMTENTVKMLIEADF